MKAFFTELFHYNYHFNQEIISVLSKNSEKTPPKCLRLLSHILNAHEIWNCKFEPDNQPYDPWKIHQLEDLHEMDRKNFEHSIIILENFELNQPFQYSNSKGQIFNAFVRDLLFQIINHSTYHRGQIATEFRQSGLDPLLTDYIYYKMI